MNIEFRGTQRGSTPNTTIPCAVFLNFNTTVMLSTKKCVRNGPAMTPMYSGNGKCCYSEGQSMSSAEDWKGMQGVKDAKLTGSQCLVSLALEEI